MLIVVFLCGCAGFALLALSQPRNWRVVGSGAPLSMQATAAVRRIGYAMLAVGLMASLWSEGPAFGAVLWVVSLSFCSFTVAMLLTWKSRA